MAREQAVSYIDFGGARGTMALVGALFARGALGNPTATGAQTMASVVLPANTLDVDGMALRFTMLATLTANANSKIITVTFGGSTILSATTTVATDTIIRAWGVLVRTGASTQVTIGQEVHSNSGTTSVTTERLASTSIDLFSPVTVVFQVNAATLATDINVRLCAIEGLPVCTLEQ